MEFAEPVAKRTEMLELGLIFRIRDTREINLEKLLKTRAIRGRVQDTIDVIEDILGCGIFADGSIDLRPDMLIEVWMAKPMPDDIRQRYINRCRRAREGGGGGLCVMGERGEDETVERGGRFGGFVLIRDKDGGDTLRFAGLGEVTFQSLLVGTC